jgi:argininosuccinate lyase
LSKLWNKGYQFNKKIEKFSVGNDYLLDHNLVRADVYGSLAHVKMLEKMGIISESEHNQIKEALLNVLKLHRDGKFNISVEDEDVHTRLENHLTQELGELGKKVHTARSRNDQVLVDIRLYTREKLLDLKESLLAFCRELLNFSRNNEKVPMPGRTHTQRAMPSSVALWSAALLESLLDDLCLLDTAYRLNNQCPLGSAASYGVPLDIDRQLTSDLLGFDKVQNNVLYAGNSRGKMESIVLFALSQIMLDLSKLATDLIFFSLPELGYFDLPQELCDGSSIMPQKRNPAGMELVRGKASTVLACLFQIMETVKSLPSGYNRDLQETKEPYMKALEITESSIEVCHLVISRLKVNEDALRTAFGPDLFATDRVLELVEQGVPFRDAYREVAQNYEKLELLDPVESIAERVHLGAPGNLGLEKLNSRIAEETEALNEEREKHQAAISLLLDM